MAQPSCHPQSQLILRTIQRKVPFDSISAQVLSSHIPTDETTNVLPDASIQSLGVTTGVRPTSS
jgi:hypothetical protein